MISSFPFFNLYFFNVMFRPKVKVNFYIIHVPFFIFLQQKLFARVQSYSKKKRKHIICVSKRKKRFFIHFLFFIYFPPRLCASAFISDKSVFFFIGQQYFSHASAW